MLKNRFVLYRPSAGLYDIFCQIGQCLEYSRKWNRTLLVDSNYQESQHFCDKFSNYFISKDPNFLLDIDQHEEILNGLSALPREVQGRIDSYQSVNAENRPYRIEKNSLSPLSFDFARDHAEQLLVHHAGGRSSYPLLPLGELYLQSKIRNIIIERLKEIGGQFQSIHVRATDYDSDYKAAVYRLRDQLKGRILLATDNQIVVDYFRDTLPDSKIFCFTQFSQDVGAPLHHITDRNLAYRRNLDSIADMIMLACGQKLHVLELKSNIFGAKYSGFSIMAMMLMKNPSLIRQLLSVSS